MSPDFSKFGPLLFTALVLLVIYRRLRRNFGRQLLSPARMSTRVVLFAIAGCAMLPTGLRSTAFSASMVSGALLGIALAAFGAQRTRFLKDQERLYYVPHTYTGVIVSTLFIGRLVYRFVEVYGGANASHASAGIDQAPALNPASLLRSPLTVGLFCVLIGYYVCYYSLLLNKSKHLKPADLDSASVSVPS